MDNTNETEEFEIDTGNQNEFAQWTLTDHYAAVVSNQRAFRFFAIATLACLFSALICGVSSNEWVQGLSAILGLCTVASGYLTHCYSIEVNFHRAMIDRPTESDLA